MKIMNEGKRTRLGLCGSLAFHLLLLLFISATGLLSFKLAEGDGEITEVSYVGGGGGGGGGAIDETPAPQEEQPQDQQETAPPEPVEQAPEDAIFDKSTTAPQPAETPKPRPKPRPRRQGNEAANTGSGGGIGSGTGTGEGSGTGSGSGSGNGSGHGDGDGDGIGSGSGGVYVNPAIPPRLISSTPPDYPLSARRAGASGTAVVSMLIGTDGSVEEASVISSTGNDELDEAAVAACRQWSFTGAKNKAGRSVRCYITQPITFRLK